MSSQNILDLTEKVYAGHSLDQTESSAFFSAVMKGELNDIVLTAMLTALKIKGETPEEIAGAASAMVQNALPFPRPDYAFADIVGTGGDGHNTINISSASAIVAASCGLPVAKHGNRSVSSKSGSADLFREMGLKLEMPPEVARKCLDEANLCFLFAPVYHAGVRHAMPVRTTLKTRTIFNLLGPLANPAKPEHILIGVYDSKLILPFAQTLKLLGYKSAMVVHGAGLDEIALHGVTHIAELKNDHINEYQVTATDFGLPSYALSDIEGGEPQENREMIAAALNGKGQMAHQHAVAANTGVLLKLAGKTDSFVQGAEMALNAMALGTPMKNIEQAAIISQGSING